MMKKAGLFLSLVSAAWAVPAVIWKNEPNSHHTTVHHSEDVSFEHIMSRTFSTDGLKVVFLLGRQDSGEEALTPWSSSGALPGVASESEKAHCVHHHVSNVQNAQSVAAMANRVGKGTAMKVSMEEFATKLDLISSPHEEAMEVSSNGMVSKSVHSMNKRKRALKEANILIVDVPAKAGPSALDSTVVQAIESNAIDTVILSSVRSIAEVKFERDMMVHRRRVLMEKEGIRMKKQARGRRLEDGGNDENDFGDDDIRGTYYVSMTPNIFAGLLFFLLFSVTTLIGISCMNMISGQDTYVSKMPMVGREA